MSSTNRPQRPRGLPLVTSTIADGEMSLESVRRAFVHDFYDSWDSVAANPKAVGRGNFMYAFMASNYLEWAATIAQEDPAVAESFARRLDQRDPHYFQSLPVPWPVKPKDWVPAARGGNRNHVLWAVFDLVRNGLAHRYQQIDAVLTDGRFRVQIVGAQQPAYRVGDRRPSKHLRPFEVDVPGAPHYLVMRLHPDVLFADVDAAVVAAGIVSLSPLKFKRTYAVTVARLRRAVGRGKRKA